MSDARHIALSTEYRGCRIELIIELAASVQLKINGIIRDESASLAGTATLRLNSTVQTDYEWHEFIEGIVQYSQDFVEAKIFANNAELVTQTYSRLPA